MTNLTETLVILSRITLLGSLLALFVVLACRGYPRVLQFIVAVAMVSVAVLNARGHSLGLALWLNGSLSAIFFCFVLILLRGREAVKVEVPHERCP